MKIQRDESMMLFLLLTLHYIREINVESNVLSLFWNEAKKGKEAK